MKQGILALCNRVRLSKAVDIMTYMDLSSGRFLLVKNHKNLSILETGALLHNDKEKNH